MPDPDPIPPAPPKYAWPKYVLGAVALFVVVCIVWTFREVNRLKRAKEDAGRDFRPAPGSTN